jgi:hypothetical protein
MSHKKTGRPVGRPKGAISKRRAVAQEVLAQLEAELGKSVNPLEGLLRIGADTAQPLAVRVQCMSESLPYLFPKLQSQTVALTGPNGDGPVAIATLDVGDLITHRPELANALVEASLLLTAQEAQADWEARGLPAPLPQLDKPDCS